MKCKHCGQDLVEGTKTCLFCGKSIVDEPVMKKSISKEESKLLRVKRFLAKIIAYYSILFGCLGIIGVFGISDNILLSYILIVASIVMGPLIIHYVNKDSLKELPFILVLIVIYSVFEYMSLALLVDPDLITYFIVYQVMVGLPVLLIMIYIMYAVKFQKYKNKMGDR